MTQRERNLAIIVATLVVGYGVWIGWGEWQSAVGRRQSDLQAAELRLSEVKLRAAEARASLQTLADLRDRSLPSDLEVAQSAYRAWLVEELENAKLDFDRVGRVNDPQQRGDAYTALTFSAEAVGNLASITRFLHAFYASPATHKITLLTLTPLDPDGNLRMKVDIAAAVVTGASNNTELPSGQSDRLRLNTLDAYLRSIDERNLFVAYRPPSPPKPEKKDTPPKKTDKPSLDHAEHAYLTGIVQAGDRLQAWIFVRTTGDQLRLFEGDALEVGEVNGRVTQVSARQMVYEVEGQRFLLTLGDHLHEATEAPDEKLL